jgi:hypothetical protein
MYMLIPPFGVGQVIHLVGAVMSRLAGLFR